MELGDLDVYKRQHMWWGLYLPVYLTMFFIIEHLITDNYWATQTLSLIHI